MKKVSRDNLLKKKCWCVWFFICLFFFQPVKKTILITFQSCEIFFHVKPTEWMKPCGGSRVWCDGFTDSHSTTCVFQTPSEKNVSLALQGFRSFLRCWTVKTNFNCWCLLYRSAASSARWTAPSWRHWSRWECTKSTTFFMLRCKQAFNCRAWKHFKVVLFLVEVMKTLNRIPLTVSLRWRSWS